MTVAALYVQNGGCYYGLPDVDPWDEERDARTYAGPHPVVAHPPCARWCQLAGLVQHRYGLKIGDDGGCFSAALASVRRWGGVLEHPAETIAWKEFALPRPPKTGWAKAFCGGWVTEVEQGNYGHRARKRTWLYLYSADPVPLRWGKSTAKAWVSWGDYDRYGYVERLSKRERAATPVEFRDLLLTLARSAQK